MAREQILWNRGWKSRHGDFPAAAAPAFDDSAWADICLPHSFGIPYFTFLEILDFLQKKTTEKVVRCMAACFLRG